MSSRFRNQSLLSRRALLQEATLAGLSFGILGSNCDSTSHAAPAVKASASAAKALPAPPAAPLQPLIRFPRMVQEYFVRRLRELEEAGNRRRASITSHQGAEAYVRDVRSKALSCLGPWPEKSPLRPRVLGTLDRGAYSLQRIVFESRPSFLVSANLYLPSGRKGPLPAVVGTCGHADNGKASLSYQSFSQGLARLGYVVLTVDPIGQAERSQYVDAQFKPLIHNGIVEHSRLGPQLFLAGDSLASWMTWDLIRAIDYLETRPEVDPKRIGVTGNSGGGTEATWLCGVEPRLKMAAPGCFITSMRRNLENEMAADAEQYLPKMLKLGLDEADLIAAMAPRAAILLGKEQDFFDVRGLEESYARLRSLYRLLGAEENIALFVGPGSHGYSQDNREAMYRFFNKQCGLPDFAHEPTLSIEKDDDVRCTPNGQVAELGSRSAFALVSERTAAKEASRPRPTGEALKAAVTSALRLRPRSGVPDYRILRPLSTQRGYPKPHFVTFLVDTEPGIQAAVYELSPGELYSRPHNVPKSAVLFISDLSADVDLREESLIREVMESDKFSTYYACDVRGIGESRPNTCAENAYLSGWEGGEYFYAAHSVMLDDPYVGQRTFDVLRVIDWLVSVGHQRVHLVGRGWGALPATFAAVISDVVTQVTLKNSLNSYAELLKSEFYQWPLSAFIPNVLSYFDLPDCYQALAAKQLRQVDLLGPNQHPPRRAVGW